MKAFAALYRKLDSGTSTRAKQAAMVEFFAAAKADPARWASAAWAVYFLSGGKPRQTAPTRLLWRLAVEGSGYPDWLCAECYGAVGDLAEMLTLILPEGARGADVSLDIWMRERLLPLPSLDEEERYARLRQWVGELADRRAPRLLQADHRRIARRRVAAAGREGAGRSRGRRRRAHGATADRLCAGAADPDGRRFRGADRRGRPRGSAGARRGQALSVLSRAIVEPAARRDGGDARAAVGLDRRMEVRRHPRAIAQARRELAPVVARRRADFRRLSRSRAAGARAAVRRRRSTASLWC